MSPHLSITSQWEQTTARHNVNWMRQLVPIGLGCASSVRTRRTVSRTGPGFSLAFGRYSSARGRERAAPVFGFDFGSAEPENLVCILNRLSVDVILICGEKIEHMPELMEEDQNLSVHRITRVGSHVCQTRTTMVQRPAFLPNFNHAGHWIEKRPFCVDRNRRVPSVALKNFGDIRIPEKYYVA